MLRALENCTTRLTKYAGLRYNRLRNPPTLEYQVPKAFVVNRCIFCGNLPCTCNKPATAAKHPTRSQHTARKPKNKPAVIETAEEPAPPTPEPVKKSVPRAKPIASLQAPAAAPPPAPVIETASFGDVKSLSENDEMERAIGVLRDAGVLHPHDPHSTPAQRAAMWRAREWRRRHAVR